MLFRLEHFFPHKGNLEPEVYAGCLQSYPKSVTLIHNISNGVYFPCFCMPVLKIAALIEALKKPQGHDLSPSFQHEQDKHSGDKERYAPLFYCSFAIRNNPIQNSKTKGQLPFLSESYVLGSTSSFLLSCSSISFYLSGWANKLLPELPTAGDTGAKMERELLSKPNLRY